MCFSVPIRIISISNGWLKLETGDKIKNTLGKKVRSGDYARISGNIVIDTLTKKEGDAIRTLILNLNR